MERFQTRESVVAELESLGLLERVEDLRHSVGHCQRCDSVVEPLVSLQWFINVGSHQDPDSIAGRAHAAVKNGDIQIVPERFGRVYLNWLENIRDWCISRQLWWGHRIPVWYCDGCGQASASIEDLESCPSCSSVELHQDPDVLDTWFSSGLWPHSTLGWPDNTDDLRRFYPTTVLECGYDILFFWVARMIMMGIENTGQVPFRTVFLHGLIRDASGAKMSKTRGNTLDPLELVERYGTDALRFALTTGTAPGNDMRITDGKLEAARNFANKVWNAARYVISTSTGWRTYAIGVSAGNCGGGTVSRSGIATAADRPARPSRTWRAAPAAAQSNCIRTRTFWIPGSALGCGPIPPWAGRITPTTCGGSTQLLCWNAVTISCFSGLPA